MRKSYTPEYRIWQAVLLALLLALASPAFAQSVQQSGNITPGHVAQWLTTGVIGDGGPVGGGATLSGSFTINDFVCANASGTAPSLIDCGLSATGTNNWTGAQNLNGGGTAPTRATSDSTTNIATTAFVQAAIGSANGVLSVTQFTGSDVGVQINACLAALPALGGICDARALLGNNLMAETVVVPDNATLLLCGVTLRGTVSPIMTYGNGSRILGCSQNTTTIEGFGGINQVGITSRSVSLTSNATISDLAIEVFGATGTTGLIVANHGTGLFYNILIVAPADSSNTGLVVNSSAGIGTYYNNFWNLRVSGGGKSVNVIGNANENKFFSGFYGNSQYCFYFGPSDHNVVVGASCENWTADGVHFEADTAGDEVLATRFESYVGTNVVNNQGTSINSVIDAYAGGTVEATVDPNGTLNYTTNFATSGVNVFNRKSPIVADNYRATAAAPTVAAGQIGYGSTTVAAGASTGGGTCPTGTVGGAAVAGCIIVNIAGTARGIPFF